MNERQQRGLQIAALSKLTHKGSTWTVPSQSGNGSYKVRLDEHNSNCTCPDFDSHHEKCKHIFAVEFVIQRENSIEKPQMDIPLRAKKVYTQNWPAYRLAQINEKAKFLELLYGLCSNIDEPIQFVGRTKVPMRDIIFAMAFKIYSTISTRRFISDLRDAYNKRYLSKLPCYNSIINYLEKEETTSYLKSLITQSALPLKSVETDFAVDSSGFSTCSYVRWFDEKYGKEQSEKDWVKAHLVCGVKTNIVTSVEISGAHGADHNYFAPLVNETAKYFIVKEISADKAYSSKPNLRLVENKGAIPYIDFKYNSIPDKKCVIWSKMLHYYNFNKEEFMDHYHKRSNVESTFSMIKAKFGGSIRSKLPVAQTNEVLCKVLCHNICCLIQSNYELGIDLEELMSNLRSGDVFG